MTNEELDALVRKLRALVNSYSLGVKDTRFMGSVLAAVEALRADRTAQAARIRELEQQLAEAREDSARLDWADNEAYAVRGSRMQLLLRLVKHNPELTLRGLIDARLSYWDNRNAARTRGADEKEERDAE